jgi:hypothetical protein
VDSFPVNLIIIIIVLSCVCFGLILYFGCQRFCHRQQLKLDGATKSLPNPAYDDYTHEDSCPPPQYTSHDSPYQYKFVPSYDSQQINEMLKTPPIGAVEKSTFAPV